jgi:ABC-type amino acid transport substrate-binding protein
MKAIGSAGFLIAAIAIAYAQADIAPTGTLRAAYLSTNPAQAIRDVHTGEVRGVSVDLARELAKQIGKPLDFIRGLAATAAYLERGVLVLIAIPLELGAAEATRTCTGFASGPCEDALTGRRDRPEVAGAEHQLGGNGKVSRPTMSIANPSKLISTH